MSDSRRVEINDRTFIEFLDDGGCCIEQDLDRPGVTVYLEPEDRSALLWALLEADAERVVLAVSGDGLEHRVRWHKWHRPILVDEDGDLHFDGLLAEPSRKEAILFCAGVRVAAEVGQEKARAIQEQRKREQERAVVEDFQDRISAALERGDLVRNPNGSLSINREVSGE